MSDKVDTETDRETKEYLVTATIPADIEPDEIGSWVEAYYEPSAHSELRVVDPDTQEVVWSLEEDQR